MSDPPWLQTIWNVLLFPDQDIFDFWNTQTTYELYPLLQHYPHKRHISFLLYVKRFLFLLFWKSKCIKLWKYTTFSFIFTSNVKTVKIDNSHTKRIEGRIEMSLFMICIYVINISHVCNEIVCSNGTYWKMLRIFVSNLIFRGAEWLNSY